jgi:Protein of unknown function (DUF3662)/FHA domain
MNLFRDFEKKLEGVFEGVFLRAFKSGVQPVELGKKLVREMEGHKSIGIKRVYVPNRYEVGLSSKDFSRFESYQAVLATELENLLISYMKEKNYVVLDRPRLKMTEDQQLREGEFWIKTRIEGELPREREPEESMSGIIVLPEPPEMAALELLDSGDDAPAFLLDRDMTTMGRTPDNDVVLPDPNVSRTHAMITRHDRRYTITDRGSTNGTFLNEKRVREAELAENDVLRLGTTRLIFRRAPD